MARDKDRENKIVANVIDSQAHLENRRFRKEQVWRDIGRNIVPVRADIRQEQEAGERRWEDIYDGTGQSALDIFVNGIFGNFVSPAFNWFKLQMRDEELNDIREVKIYLQAVEEQMYGTLNASNYYDEKFLQIQDGGTLGTAPLYITEDFEESGIIAQAIHPAEAYISQNNKNVVDQMHRKVMYSLKQIISEFGEENVPDEVLLEAESNPYQEREVIHAVFKRMDYDPFKVDFTNMPYASMWVLPTSAFGKSSDGGGQGKGNLLREGGFRNFPYHIWRPYRDTRDEYGRSPAERALADCMGLNIMGRTMLGVAEKAAEPPMAAHSEMEGMLDFSPRGINYFSNKDNIPQPIGSFDGYPISIDQMERKAQFIREAFNVDFFQLLSQTARSGRTAREVEELQGERIPLLASSFTQLTVATQMDLERIFEIENEAGRMPEPPEILGEGTLIDIVFLSPLAQLQSRLFQGPAIQDTIAEVGIVAQLYPNVLNDFDPHKLVRKIAENNGFPAEVVNPLEEVLEAERIEREKRAQAEQLAAAESASKSVSNLAKADKDTDGKISQSIGEG
jgi:hypothetical protein